MVEVKAKLRYLRIAPRKVRLLVDLIRGLNIREAGEQLKFSKKRAARPLLKLLKSAESNARHNLKMDKERLDNLYIKEIRVDQGPVLKRYLARAFGRATLIRKKTSHISLILEEKK